MIILVFVLFMLYLLYAWYMLETITDKFCFKWWCVPLGVFFWFAPIIVFIQIGVWLWQ